MSEYVYGVHAVSQLFLEHPQQIVQLLVLKQSHKNRLKKLLDDAAVLGVTIKQVDKQQLIQLVGDVSHQGIIAEYHQRKNYDEADLVSLLDVDKPLLLVLDGVQDPHNLGACLRTADAAGVQAVIIPKDRAVGLNATVRKVACGAAETVPFIVVTNLARTLDLLKQQGVWIVGTSGEATKSIHEIDLTGPIALVMGAEGKGLRRLTMESCDYMAAIPLQGTMASLNVSVATGICLFESIRQRAITSYPQSQ